MASYGKFNQLTLSIKSHVCAGEQPSVVELTEASHSTHLQNAVLNVTLGYVFFQIAYSRSEDQIDCWASEESTLPRILQDNTASAGEDIQRNMGRFFHWWFLTGFGLCCSSIFYSLLSSGAQFYRNKTTSTVATIILFVNSLLSLIWLFIGSALRFSKAGSVCAGDLLQSDNFGNAPYQFTEGMFMRVYITFSISLITTLSCLLCCFTCKHLCEIQQ